jgi:hypothetical protein
MNRRLFCTASLGFAATCPLAGPGRLLAAPAVADTSIPAVSLEGATLELEKAAVNEFADSLAGEVLLSGHPAYNQVRRIWNGMHDKRPALIARCSSAQDISNAVTFARERELLVAVRGGGHSWPGKYTSAYTSFSPFSFSTSSFKAGRLSASQVLAPGLSIVTSAVCPHSSIFSFDDVLKLT